MGKEIKITHAEVTVFYGTEKVIDEFKGEKGTTLTFNVKSKFNDRVPNSPHFFERCQAFCTSEEQVNRIKQYVQIGNVLEIKGTGNQYNYIDKETEKKVYRPQLRVTDIVPIQVSEPVSEPDTSVEENDELPF